MSNKICMNDIAEALNMSRNTISKAFNNQYLPEKTRTLILNKAIELGYKNLDQVSKRETILHKKNILILTINDIQNLNFFLSVIRGIDSIVSKYDLNLFQYQFDSLQKIKDFKGYVEAKNISGILCLETFNKKYICQILNLNIPVVFIDSAINTFHSRGNYDIVLMENIGSVKNTMLQVAKTSPIHSFGFVGDFEHCLSFNERFIGYREALFQLEIPYTKEYNITEPDEFPYGNISILSRKLSTMNRLPECFVCANDFIAISIINALQALEKRVPEDVQVIGFDNTQDAKNFSVPLTTIDTDKELLGKEGIVTLLNRIKYIEDTNRVIHIKTSSIFRATTK